MHFVVPPAYALCLCSCVFERPNLKHFEKSNLTPPLGLRILPLFEDPQIGSDVADDVIVSDIPPWSQSEIQIRLSVAKFKKDCTTTEIHKQAFLEIAPKHEDFVQIFTDRSKVDETVAATTMSSVAPIARFHVVSPDISLLP